MDSSGNLANPQSMTVDSGIQGLAAAAGHGAGTRTEVRELVLTPHKRPAAWEGAVPLYRDPCRASGPEGTCGTGEPAGMVPEYPWAGRT